MTETKVERQARIIKEGGWRDLSEAPKDRWIECLCVDSYGGSDPGHYFAQRGRWSGSHWQSKSGSLVVAWREHATTDAHPEGTENG